MKKCSLLAAAASATVASLSSSSSHQVWKSRKSTLTEKFAPKFDGLRFIETLVTAHR
ncbi:uncharacterized protein LOC114182664 [Vigna unguiculata]|uniref:uncharacterized protein LOC114182664 n=1 Tax=Vigna unguiculata TaxID=3917 RepID=UPI00101710BE|nr:uncharacterized protein LOC114182664 [Vigna unguiculata]